jgi:putative transposase
MARLARVVIAGHPHHVTQRGNGGARTFFSDADYALYRDLLEEHCRAAEVAVWSWCLMPNHAHLVLVPSDEDGLRRALAPAHRRYAGVIHARRRRTGHFWQGRFGAVAMDEEHLRAALAYGALNPVRARLVARARDWRWSSTRAHLSRRDDGITALAPVRERIPDFAAFLAGAEDGEAFARLRAAESVGRPVGDERFMAGLERVTRRSLRPGRRGPKPKEREAGSA